MRKESARGARNRARRAIRALHRGLSQDWQQPITRGRTQPLLSGLDTADDRSGNPPDQRALHASARRFFEALARQRPLCWMVEDIQWADDTLLDLIELVAKQAKEAPLLVLTQARPSLLEKRLKWGTGVGGFTSLTLETLSTQAGHELILALCRERGLPATVAGEVGRGAGGKRTMLS